MPFFFSITVNADCQIRLCIFSECWILLLSSLCPIGSVVGVKSSLLSSHQSAGIWSMPRSLCAAKRQIKETVISSTASAADSFVAVAEGPVEMRRRGGYTSTKCRRGKSQNGGVKGRRRGEDRAARCGSAPWYKALQLSQTLWREKQAGVQGMRTAMENKKWGKD